MTGRISQQMLELVAPDFKERHIYICGPQGFMDAAKEIVAGTGFDMNNYHAESFGGVRTGVANKQMPVGVPPTLLSAGQGELPETVGGISIEFAKSGKTVRTTGKLPLLDVAEATDVDVGYSCRAGSCGECKVKLLKGEVTMSSEDGLEPGDKEKGCILSCVALPKTDCVIDA
jgi:ferredoxin